MEPEDETQEQGTPQAPAANEAERVEETNTNESTGGGNASFDERIKKLNAKHEREIAAKERDWQKRFDQQKKESDKVLDEIRKKLGIEAENDEDPVEVAERRTASSTLAARRAAFRLAAIDAGIPVERVDAAFKLANVEGIDVGSDGTTSGEADVVAALLESDSWILEGKTGPKRVGAPTNPEPSESRTIDDPNAMNDPQFVRENRDAIAARARKSLYGD